MLYKRRSLFCTPIVLLWLFFVSVTNAAENFEKDGNATAEECATVLTAKEASKQPAAPLAKLEKPTTLSERLYYYREKLIFSFLDSDGQFKFRFPDFGIFFRSILSHLNPLSDSHKTKNHTLDGDESEDGDASISGDDEDAEKTHIVGAFNRSSIAYFRRQVLQNLYFLNGRYETASVLTGKQKELSLGISSAVMHLENPLPGKTFELPIPAGYRVIVQPFSSSVKVWRDSSDRYFFRSFKRGKATVHFSEERAQDLTRLERQAYTTVHEPIALSEWPENFGILLRALVEHIQSRRGALSNSEIAAAVKSLVQNYFLYSRSQSNAQTTLEMILEGRCQCNWAAVLTTGILRQYFGIPSRVVVGDTGKAKEGSPDVSYIVRSDALHAWSEVYEPTERKWQIVDATPTKQEGAESKIWDDLLNALTSALTSGGSLSQKDDSFYDIDRKSEGSSALADFFSQWGSKLQSNASKNASRSGRGSSFRIDFNMSDFLNKWFSNSNDPELNFRTSSKADRSARIRYSILESAWQHALEGSDDSLNQLINRLLLFKKYLITAESKAVSSNDPEKAEFAPVYVRYRKRVEIFLTKLSAFGFFYKSNHELIMALTGKSESKKVRAAATTLLLFSQITAYRSLTPYENKLLQMSQAIISYAETRENGSKEHQRAIFDTLSEHGKAFAVDYELRKAYGVGSSVDLDQFWSDYKSGKLNNLIEVVRQGYFTPDFPISSQDRIKVEVPGMVPVPISDYDEDIGHAEDLARYGNFTKKGYGLQYDLFRFATGLMEERQYKDKGDHLKEEHQPGLVATVVTNTGPYTGHASLALRVVAAAILRGENIVLLTTDEAGNVLTVWNPDEILKLGVPGPFSENSFNQVLSELRPSRVLEIHLIKREEPTIIGYLNIKDAELLRTVWELEASDDTLAASFKAASESTLFKFPHWSGLESGELNSFKKEFEQINLFSLNQQDQRLTKVFEIDIPTERQKLKTTDLMNWERFKKILDYRVESTDHFAVESDPLLSEVLGEWQTQVDDFMENLDLADDSFRARAMQRFSEVVMGRKLALFALTLPKPLLKDFIRRLLFMDAEIRRAYNDL